MLGPAGYWLRVALRGRRRAALGLVALAVVAAVVPLLAAAGARRTASSPDRMRDELRPYHLDLQFDEGPPPADALERIAGIPGVEIVAEGASLLARPAGSDAEPFQSFGQGALDDRLGRAFERPRLDAGRLPTGADEVLVSRRLAEGRGLEVGDTLALETFSPEGMEATFAGEPSGHDGPVVELRVVGVGRQPEELTVGADAPVPSFVVSSAFLEAWQGRVHFFPGIFLVRLEDGPSADGAFSRDAQEAFPDRPDVAIHTSEEAARIDDAVGAQTVALYLLAAVAFVVGTLALAQAGIRLARSVEPDARVLAAVGVGRVQLAAARGGLVLVPVLTGILLAIAAAALGSGLFPNGPAGRLEPEPGIRVDAAVLALGGASMVVAPVVATVLLARPRVAWRARPSRLADLIGRGALPVAANVGLRSALRGGRDPAATSTRSATIAIGAAVAGVAGALVFAASLDRLVASPPRQGWNWDYEVALGDELSDEDAVAEAEAVGEDPRIERALYVRIASKDIADRPTFVFGIAPVRGDLHPTLVEGEPVRADDEVVLGRTTLDELGVSIGDTVPVELDGRGAELRVVGQGLFPTNENDDPASGAVVTLATAARLPGSGGFPDLFITVDPDADEQGLRDDLEESFGYLTGAVPPPVVSNLELVDRVPYLLGAYLATLGLAAAIHALVLVVRQRRHELATLRTLGFDRHQVAWSVIAHATTIGLIGVLVGLPIGAAMGRTAWRLVAGGLGFATDPRVPPLLPAGALAAVVAVGIVALGPALWAARQRPAAVLRAE